MKKQLLVMVASIAFPMAVEASPPPIEGASFLNTANATNQAQNQQTASGSVYATGGSQVNVQQNNQNANDYGFAPGVFCRTTTFNIGFFGSANNGSASFGLSSSAANYGAVMGFSVPIGGQIGNSCEELAAEIVKQRQLDTSLNFIRQCAVLKKEKINFDPAVFPEFSKCDGVKLDLASSVKESPPEAIFTPRSNAVPVVPIR